MATTPVHSTVIPGLRYRDAHAAIDWLCRVLGFTPNAVYEGPDHTVAHAQLAFGSGMIMLGSHSNPGELSAYMNLPSETGGRETQSSYLVSPDAAALFEQATAAGAEVLLPLRTMGYGGQAFTLRDPEGHLWSVGEYNPWHSPAS